MGFARPSLALWIRSTSSAPRLPHLIRTKVRKVRMALGLPTSSPRSDHNHGLRAPISGAMDSLDLERAAPAALNPHQGAEGADGPRIADLIPALRPQSWASRAHLWRYGFARPRARRACRT